MYARNTALVVLAVLLFSSFSGMVSGSVIESYEASDNNSDQASLDESKWNLFENPVGHPHHTKQSSGIIHSPSDHSTHWIKKFLHSNGRVAQLALIYPIGRSTLSSLQTLISRA